MRTVRKIAFFFLITNALFAQEKTSIQIINSDYTYFDQALFPDIRRLVGNVKFKHKGAIMACDSAWYYFKQNRFVAYSNVKINQGDTIFLSGERLDYNGKTKKAIIYNDIKLRDQNMILTTDQLDYSLETNIASYYDGAKIVNSENILISIKGKYLSDSKFLIFKDSVILNNPSYVINCDTLHFHTIDEIAYFYGPTTIQSDENLIYCENGWYNTQTDLSQYNKNAFLKNEDQYLSGDSLFYDRNMGYGIAINNVEILDTINKYSIYGQKAEYFERADSSIITQNPLLISLLKDDSLFLHSDTIIANLDTLKHRQIKAFTGVKFFSDNLQGTCQELHYYMRDSSIHMFTAPVLWASDYQLTAQQITLFLVNENLDRLQMQNEAFITSKDSLELFNQIRGKNMTGYFKNNDLYKMFVDGNGQATYVIKDEFEKVSGINTVSCSQMNIYINNREIEKISFQQLPNAIIYPFEDLPNEWKRLDGFINRFSERILDKNGIWN